MPKRKPPAPIQISASVDGHEFIIVSKRGSYAKFARSLDRWVGNDELPFDGCHADAFLHVYQHADLSSAVTKHRLEFKEMKDHDCEDWDPGEDG